MSYVFLGMHGVLSGKFGRFSCDRNVDIYVVRYVMKRYWLQGMLYGLILVALFLGGYIAGCTLAHM